MKSARSIIRRLSLHVKQMIRERLSNLLLQQSRILLKYKKSTKSSTKMSTKSS